jgi:hypothetical protein
VDIKLFLDSFPNPGFIIYKALKIKEILYSPDSDKCEMIAYKFYILNSANLLIADNKHCIVG